MGAFKNSANVSQKQIQTFYVRNEKKTTTIDCHEVGNSFRYFTI